MIRPGNLSAPLTQQQRLIALVTDISSIVVSPSKIRPPLFSDKAFIIVLICQIFPPHLLTKSSPSASLTQGEQKINQKNKNNKNTLGTHNKLGV